MQNKWSSIEKMRKTTIDISGWDYSEEFAKKHKLIKRGRSFCYGENPSVWIPEPIEIMKDCDDKILFLLDKSKSWNYENKEEFHTSLGKFISQNNGEFGGTLITPKETIHGNFVEVFECAGKTYAIDSCNHMGIGHVNIYVFTEDAKSKLLFSHENLGKEDCSKFFSFKSLYIHDDKAFILISGEFAYGWNDEKRKSTDKAFLFEINQSGFKIKAEFNQDFDWVNNMIIVDNHMFLGMDKVVADVDIVTKSVIAYTNLSEEAEQDILKLRKLYQ